jgi:hypothetical protein
MRAPLPYVIPTGCDFFEGYFDEGNPHLSAFSPSGIRSERSDVRKEEGIPTKAQGSEMGAVFSHKAA